MPTPVSLNDSPISRLNAEAQLSSVDLFLISKKLNADEDKYSSNKITYNDVASNIISSMSHELSSLVQKELSTVVGGTVTLTTWKTK